MGIFSNDFAKAHQISGDVKLVAKMKKFAHAEIRWSGEGDHLLLIIKPLVDNAKFKIWIDWNDPLPVIMIIFIIGFVLGVVFLCLFSCFGACCFILFYIVFWKKYKKSELVI